MGHTVETINAATKRHDQLTRFLNNAHSGTADVTVSARNMGKGRAAEASVPRAVAQPVIDYAIEEVRKLEAEFGIRPWAAPKAVHGKPAQSGTKAS